MYTLLINYIEYNELQLYCTSLFHLLGTSALEYIYDKFELHVIRNILLGNFKYFSIVYIKRETFKIAAMVKTKTYSSCPFMISF